MDKLIYGVGYNNGLRKTRVNGIQLKEYKTWLRMIRRCYDIKSHSRQPTYKDCEVSDFFKSYSNFYEWCQDQIGFNCDDYELDKDLLVKNNKTYSEHSCIFLPKTINSVLTKCNTSRGLLPLGVTYFPQTNKYRARVRNGQENLKSSGSLGLFNTEIEAFNAYKRAKESYLKELAEKWKDKIDPRAYNALMNYQVEITD